jgi:hypothetical protein
MGGHATKEGRVFVSAISGFAEIELPATTARSEECERNRFQKSRRLDQCTAETFSVLPPALEARL